MNGNDDFALVEHWLLRAPHWGYCASLTEGNACNCGFAKAKLALARLQQENLRLRGFVKRTRQGYSNILEFRRIRGSDRYGGLTHAEIEQTMAECDAALTAEAKPEAPATGGCMADWSPGEEAAWNALTPEQQKAQGTENLREAFRQHIIRARKEGK